MREASPRVVVIGGPNGAGKSTVAGPILRDEFGIRTFVNADVIARGLSDFNPEAQAFAAGRIMLNRLRGLASARESFAFEVTLASRSFAPWLARLGKTGYVRHVVYLWLDSAETAVQRVPAGLRPAATPFRLRPFDAGT